MGDKPMGEVRSVAQIGVVRSPEKMAATGADMLFDHREKRVSLPFANWSLIGSL